MVHLVGGHLAVPTGRQGARATQVNINVNEQNFFGGGTEFYGNTFGMPGQYGMPGMYGNMYGGGCYGEHNQSWNLLDYLLGIGSGVSGFFQGFLAKKAPEKAENPQTTDNNNTFQEAMEQNKKMLQERQNEHQRLVDEIAELKAASQAQQNPASPVTLEEEAEELQKEGITKNADGTYSKEFTDIFGKKIEIKGNSADEVRALYADAENAKAADEGICDSFGIKKLANGKFSYSYTVNYNGQEEQRATEFESLDDLDRVILEADRIKKGENS